MRDRLINATFDSNVFGRKNDSYSARQVEYVAGRDMSTDATVYLAAIGYRLM